MPDLQRAGHDEEQSERDPDDQRDQMSTRAERRRQERRQATAPKGPSGGTIAAIVLVLAMVGIIAYAVVQRNAQVSGAAVSPNSFPSLPPPVKAGTVAPGFSIAAKGGTITSASFAGKPYMLEIFATWCPHCQRMTAVLRDIRRKFPPSKFGMVSVTGSPIGNSGTASNPMPEDQSDVDTFDAAYGVTWPSAFDKDLTVAKTWGLQGYPAIFIVDAGGIVRYVHSGEIEEKTLVSEIQKVAG
jgi:thiol-disulfide isomerase/thioredoxin